MQCGREPGGCRVPEEEVCPAASDFSFENINSGKCGGRFCWAVAGTLCNGKIQGTFAEKRETCVTCDFYKRVQMEEGTANLRTKFLRFMTTSLNSFLFKGSTYEHIPQGTRFITQGEKGDTAYIIHRGACIEIVEKDGELHPVGHRGEGDIVGMISVLTGEARSFHVEAETDMDVWVLHKEQFDDISNNEPDLHEFLTEIVADRFDSKRPISDRTINKYQATNIIGRGGHSIVYNGIHTHLNMPVAIKMLRHDLFMREEFLESFHNEAKLIARLRHENIVNIYDIEERFKTAFIVMEYLDGESLDEMKNRLKQIPPNLAGYFILQACEALDYAHQQGIIHRDINPGNMIILKNDRLKLIDFGLACPFGTEDSHFGGSLHYMPPEMIEGELPDQRSDIYSLGITAYEIVTGEKPYMADSAGVIMKMRLTQDVPDPIECQSNIPEPLRKFILTACRRNPEKRYQNAKQAMEDLCCFRYFVQNRSGNSRNAEKKEIHLSLKYKESQYETVAQLVKNFELELNKRDIRLLHFPLQ